MRIALTLALLTTVALAQEPDAPQAPKDAWLALEAAASKLGVRERRTFLATGRKEFLAAWDKSGRTAEGEQAYYLGLFLSMSQRTAEAAQAFGKALEVPAVAADACVQFLTSTLILAGNGKASREDLVAAKESGEKALAAAEDPSTQARLQFELGRCNDRLGDGDEALACWMAAATADPRLAARVAAHGSVCILRTATNAQEARTKTETMVKLLLALPPAEAPGNARAAELMARRTAEQIARTGNAARLLGEPLPKWNALHSFGGAKGAAGYKGNFTLIHVGSTWSVSAVRALPVLRDLHEAYKDRCAMVGLWIGGMSYYESRFELDEDFTDKANGTTPVTLRERRKPGQPRGPSADQIEVLTRFFANHKLSWDHVRVPLVEYSKTYGMLAQPVLILVDAGGRVQYIRPGRLVRTDKAAVVDLRKRIDGLLSPK